MSKKKKQKKIEARDSGIHGKGVFATADIAAGERIIRYTGTLRTHDEVDEEYGGEEENGHTFLFTLNDDYVIDANISANVARWINHSCDPNCEAVLLEDAGGDPRRDRIVIESIRPIAGGEELTYNYGIVLDERHTPKLKKLWGPEVFSEPFSAETAASLTEVMIAVVNEGTGRPAQISGVQVAAKTGTAETGTDAAQHAWMIAFAPAENPQVAVALVLEHGGDLGTDAYGGSAAGPLVRDIIQAALQ